MPREPRNFDVTLKLLILDSAELLRQLGVEHVTTWLNGEMPKVQNRRADLVGKFASGTIVHIEIQLDIRELDGSKLLESSRFSDNLLSVLARLDDVTDGISKILKRIGYMKRKSDREAALSLLFQAAQLRDLQDTVSEEMQKVSIIDKTSINDKTFGPWIRKGMAKGAAKQAQRMLRLQLKKCFGVLPNAVDKRLASITETEAEKLALALIDARTLDELFPAVSGKQ